MRVNSLWTVGVAGIPPQRLVQSDRLLCQHQLKMKIAGRPKSALLLLLPGLNRLFVLHLLLLDLRLLKDQVNNRIFKHRGFDLLLLLRAAIEVSNDFFRLFIR